MLNYYERNVGHEFDKQKEAPFINKRYEHAPHLHVPSHGEKVWPCSADSGQHTYHTIARPPSYGPPERILTDQLGGGGPGAPSRPWPTHSSDYGGSGLVWSNVRQKVTLGRVPVTLQKSPLVCLLQQIWASYDNARVPTYYKKINDQ